MGTLVITETICIINSIMYSIGTVSISTSLSRLYDW